MKLTDHLVCIQTTKAYADATDHPFLRAAGSRTLKDDLLALWLSQDRIYAAHAYPRFIGLLISKIPFAPHHGVNSAEEKMNQRILKILAFCIENIVREESFFRDTSEKYGLPIDVWREREATRNYTAEMLRVGSALSLEEGLVFLWAMEKVRVWPLHRKVPILKVSLIRSTSTRGATSNP
jgi:thiaminase